MINYHHILLLPDDSTPIIHPRLFEIDPRPSINIKNSVSDVSTGDTFSLKETFSHIFIDAWSSQWLRKRKKVAFCRSPRAAVHPSTPNNPTLRDSLDFASKRELMMHPVHPASQIEVARAERASRRLD